MPCSEVNKRAKQNGDWGENKAKTILLKKFGNINYVNELIDFYADNNIPIEVKTCQNLIESGNPKYPSRFGRFTLEKDQHSILINQNGYYLFLVKNNGFVMKGRLVLAEDVTFIKQLTWKFVMNSG